MRGAARSARAELCRARGELAEAAHELHEAIELLDAAGVPHDVTVARVVLAEVLLELGRPQSAEPVARAALDVAVDLGAARETAAAQRVLNRLRSGPTGGATGVTRRELEILRLVAEGLSNAEIAGLLVLSPRTVERHVSNIYAKVGATGPSARTIAVARARSEGLLD